VRLHRHDETLVKYKIAIYVQHLLGAGHLVRAMSLADALSEDGHQLILLSGGFPIDRPVRAYAFYQLPPTRAIEGDFTRLVDEQGQPVSEKWRRDRGALLLAKVQQFRPDLLITETFPFGRRQFRFELEPLLDWVQSQPSVHLIASIRDVLQRRSDVRNRQTVETIKQYYDAVLVHADEVLFKLDASFPLSYEIEDKLIYTGYIHQPNKGCDRRVGASAFVDPTSTHTQLLPQNQSESGKDGYDEIIVSGGSGSVSARLLETARRARLLSSAGSRVWRLLTGRDITGVSTSPEPGLVIEPNRADFFTLLGRCALSVSQAGYNTTLDILASGARSLMIPFAGDGETEQNDRAQALENAGRVLRITESDLTPESLARAIDRALETEPVEIKANLNGAANSALLITQKLEEWSA